MSAVMPDYQPSATGGYQPSAAGGRDVHTVRFPVGKPPAQADMLIVIPSVSERHRP